MGRIVRMSEHHDRAEAWHREPRLTPVVEVRDRSRVWRERVVQAAIIAFAIGWVVRGWLCGVLG